MRDPATMRFTPANHPPCPGAVGRTDQETRILREGFVSSYFGSKSLAQQDWDRARAAGELGGWTLAAPLQTSPAHEEPDLSQVAGYHRRDNSPGWWGGESGIYRVDRRWEVRP